MPGTSPSAARYAMAAADPSAAIAGDRHAARLDRGWANAAISLGWSLFLLAAAGIALRLGLPVMQPAAWLIVDVAVLAALLTRPSFTAFVLRQRMQLALGALAILSTLWSIAPAMSAYHGVQLVLTVMAGLLFAETVGLERMMRIVFAALLAAALISVAFNVLAPHTSTGWQGAWKGAFGHKNTLGAMMAVLVVTAGCLLLTSWRPVLVLGALVLGVALVGLSRSGTAILTTVVTLATLPLLLVAAGSPRTRSVAAGVVLIAVATAAAALIAIDADPAEVALGALGKDSSLTGRDLLWDFAADAMAERPLLGFGFKGYWESGLPAMHVLRFAIGSDLWQFHNSFLELGVAFGPAGPLLLGLIIAASLLQAVRLVARQPSPAGVWAFAMLLLISLQCLSETMLGTNHNPMQLLFSAIVGAVALRLAGRKGGAS